MRMMIQVRLPFNAGAPKVVLQPTETRYGLVKEKD